MKLDSILFFVIVACVAACTQNTDKGSNPSLTEGNLAVVADYTYKPLLETNVETYTSQNRKANITVEYTNELEAIRKLLGLNAEFILMSRKPTEQELNLIRSKNKIPKVYHYASDALAFMLSLKSKDSILTSEQIQAILEGKSKYKLVVDRSNSANALYLKSKFDFDEKSGNIFAVGSDSALLAIVQSNPDYIGVISNILIADSENPTAKKILNSVKVLSISHKDSAGNIITSKPFQKDLAEAKYPFIRNIYIVNLAPTVSLGTGFANFMTTDRGQRIILKAGLLPSRFPGREIKIIQ
ncbi:MAG: substrate-binding domain-containing protein [Cytophagaceae bacterium]|nr:substrate-binding domain-containing protein [Cytophagaceae bacterium]MDW8457387.1 substrate-binding domain-containing protein [Cytophagaceae bacterium]